MADLDARLLAHWVTGEGLHLLKAGYTIDPSELAILVLLVSADAISTTNAKAVLAEHAASGEEVLAIIEHRGYRKLSDAGAIEVIIEEALSTQQAAVGDYRAGKTAALGFLVGVVMRATGGRADAGAVRTGLMARLNRVESGDS
jgi:aspartyl-tRNA(Asn)/glutamyl-tRNA(Gln) amidotransferase subunit B